MPFKSDEFILLRMNDLPFENFQLSQCHAIKSQMLEKALSYNSNGNLIPRRLWTRILENISGKFPFQEDLKIIRSPDR
ncbi:hypothetical protein HN011_000356 [Eciton burchellii]|nr:hypothetical protein HN011_000356 [Eciton burchellii]